MTHTRGPWKANGCEIVGDSRVVATVHWCSGMEQEDAANLRMIAAAPDLLACLKEYVRDFGDNEDGDSQLMAEKARATIAKTEGVAVTSPLCPRPVNAAPEGKTAKDCIRDGECGCDSPIGEDR